MLHTESSKGKMGAGNSISLLELDSMHAPGLRLSRFEQYSTMTVGFVHVWTGEFSQNMGWEIGVEARQAPFRICTQSRSSG